MTLIIVCHAIVLEATFYLFIGGRGAPRDLTASPRQSRDDLWESLKVMFGLLLLPVLRAQRDILQLVCIKRMSNTRVELFSVEVRVLEIVYRAKMISSIDDPLRELLIDRINQTRASFSHKKS